MWLNIIEVETQRERLILKRVVFPARAGTKVMMQGTISHHFPALQDRAKEERQILISVACKVLDNSSI